MKVKPCMPLLKKILLLLLVVCCAHTYAQNENLSNGQYFDGEPYMAIDPHNPQHIIVAWMGFTVGSPFGIKVKTSFDAGTTWSSSTFLPHLSHNFHSADPSIAFDTAGYAYACYIDYHEAPDSGGVFTVRSPDGGLTWGTPKKVMDAYDDGAQRPLDRPWFCINPVTNQFYVTTKPAPWILPPCRPYFRTSADGGNTWAAWRYIDTTGFLVGTLIPAPMAAPAVGSDGIFHCVYPSYLSSQNVLPAFVHASTTNNGATFSYHGKYFYPGGNTDTLPKMGYHLAVDPTNPQHLAFNFPGKLSNSDIDIWLIQSTDGGVNWSTPQRVNDDPINNGVMQDLTWCGFDVNGDIIVGWRDRRDATGTGYSLPSEIYAAILRKDSTNFTPNFKVSDTIAQFNATYLDHPGNDFMNIALQRDTVYAVWGDVRTGLLNVWFEKKVPGSNTPSSITLLSEDPLVVNIYPNPTTDVLNFSGEKVTEVAVTNMVGQVVLNQKLTQQKINVANLHRGLYILHLTTPRGNLSQRFIKE